MLLQTVVAHSQRSSIPALSFFDWDFSREGPGDALTFALDYEVILLVYSIVRALPRVWRGVHGVV